MPQDRRAYEAKLEAQLAVWEADLASFRAQAKDLSVDGMMKYDRTLAALAQQHGEARVHLHNLKAAGDETWEHVKAGTEKAWVELRSMFKHAE